MFDPMSELTGETEPEAAAPTPPPARKSNQSGGGGKFAKELHSATIHARQRTFYIDLKESGHGKFFKLTEKSRGGQKSTIMFDIEDLDQFIEALQGMKEHV